MKKVEITFSSEQSSEGEKEKNLLKAQGTLRKTDGGFVLRYTEPDGEMGNSKSVVEIFNKDFVRLKRTGLYETVFEIEENKPHSCFYKTPFGEMEMEIIADKVNAKLTENGGKIELSYRLEANNQPISQNQLIMDVKVIQ